MGLLQPLLSTRISLSFLLWPLPERGGLWSVLFKKIISSAGQAHFELVLQGCSHGCEFKGAEDFGSRTCTRIMTVPGKLCSSETAPNPFLQSRVLPSAFPRAGGGGSLPCPVLRLCQGSPALHPSSRNSAPTRADTASNAFPAYSTFHGPPEPELSPWLG